MDRRKYSWAIIFIYIFFTLLLFISGFFAIGFVSDDYNNLYDAVNSTIIQKLSGNLSFANTLYLSPVYFLFLQLLYYIHNFLYLSFDNFLNYRIANLFLFFLFSFLCGRMIFHLTKNYYLSLLGLLTVILLPSNIHNICWSTGIIDLLCGIFFVSYIYLTICFFEEKSVFFIAFSSFSLGLALFTKETAITALPVCLIFIYFFKGKNILKNDYNIFVVHLIILIFYFIYKFLINQFFLNIRPVKLLNVYIESFFCLFIPVDYLSVLYQLKHNDITILVYFVVFITFLFLYFIYLFQINFFKILFFAALLFLTAIIPYAVAGYVRPQLIIIPFSLIVIFLFSSHILKAENKKINFKKSLIISFCVILISWSYYTILTIQQWAYSYDNLKTTLNNLINTNIDLQKRTYILCNPGRLGQIFMLDEINGAYNYWKYRQPIFKDTLNDLVLTGGLDKESVNSKLDINKINDNEFEVTSKNNDSFFYIEGYNINKNNCVFENDLFRLEFSQFNYLNKPVNFKTKFKSKNINCYINNESQYLKIF